MMRLGMTREKRYAVMQARNKKLLNGVKRFAWFPMKLESDDWVWLDFCYCYQPCVEHRDGELSPIGDVRTYMEPSSKYVLLLKSKLLNERLK